MELERHFIILQADQKTNQGNPKPNARFRQYNMVLQWSNEFQRIYVLILFPLPLNLYYGLEKLFPIPLFSKPEKTFIFITTL